MSSKESLPYPPSPASLEEQDHPHACNSGWVSMEVEVIDPETGEETLEEALYLCRRCSGEGR
jgi:hypothetical protein